MDQLPIFLIGFVVWVVIGVVFLMRAGSVPSRLVAWYRRAAIASFVVAALDALIVVLTVSGLRPGA
jgi:hypothetical protein